jgi:Arc/MetJ-type ribon-helix-helix transcriptional regulator
MTITLSPETQKLLDEILQTGDYPSADQAIHAALDALQWSSTVTLDEETLDALDRAEDQIDRGECHAWKDVRQQVLDMFKR